MAKTAQCMKINVLGAAYICTFIPSRTNPFRLYKTWWDEGNRKKLIAEYVNFEGVLYHLIQLGVPEFRKDWWFDVVRIMEKLN